MPANLGITCVFYQVVLSWWSACLVICGCVELSGLEYNSDMVVSALGHLHIYHSATLYTKQHIIISDYLTSLSGIYLLDTESKYFA